MDETRRSISQTPSEPGWRHAETIGDVMTDAASVFDYIDQPERLSPHIARRSSHLAGSSMAMETDGEGGVGSRIRLRGRMLRFDLRVEGEVVERDPPRSKVWQTVGEPRLLVIGRNRMCVQIVPRPASRGRGPHYRDRLRAAHERTGWLRTLAHDAAEIEPGAKIIEVDASAQAVEAAGSASVSGASPRACSTPYQGSELRIKHTALDTRREER